MWLKGGNSSLKPRDSFHAGTGFVRYGEPSADIIEYGATFRSPTARQKMLYVPANGHTETFILTYNLTKHTTSLKAHEALFTKPVHVKASLQLGISRQEHGWHVLSRDGGLGHCSIIANSDCETLSAFEFGSLRDLTFCWHLKGCTLWGLKVSRFCVHFEWQCRTSKTYLRSHIQCPLQLNLKSPSLRDIIQRDGVFLVDTSSPEPLVDRVEHHSRFKV